MNKYSTISMTVLLAMCVGLLGYGVSAANSPCDVIVPETPLPFSELQQWHDAGYCGGRSIGLFVDAFPVRSRVLMDDGGALLRLVLQDEQQQRWATEAVSDRVNLMLNAIHRVAPNSAVYLYHIALTSGASRPLNADDLLVGWNWMREQGVSIVVNATAYPLYTDDDIERLQSAMTLATDEGVVWINAAGNFGNSFYQGVYRASSAQPWYHEFSPDLRTMLPFYILNSGDVGIFYELKSDKPQDSFELNVYSDPNNRSESGVEARYFSIDESRGLLRLSGAEAGRLEAYFLQIYYPDYSDVVNASFELYFANAAIATEGEASPGSIPPPNAFEGALTVGALPFEFPSGARVSSGQSGTKPDVQIDGTLPNEQGISSGLSSAIAAGIAAVYWSDGSPYQQTSTSEISALLLQDRQADRTLSVVGLPSPVRTEHVLALAAVGLVVFLGVRTLRRRAFEAAVQKMELVVSYKPDEKRLIFELLKVPVQGNWRMTSLRRYTRRVYIQSKFDADLSSKPTLNSPLQRKAGSRTNQSHLGASLNALPLSADAHINRSTTMQENCFHEEQWETAVCTVSLDTNCIEKFEQPAIYWSLDFDTLPHGPSMIHLQVNSFSPSRILFSASTHLDLDRTTADVPSVLPYSDMTNLVPQPAILPTDDTIPSGTSLRTAPSNLQQVNLSPALTKTRLVFVSYARKDNRHEKIRSLVSALDFESRSDLEFWFDERDIMPGNKSWKDEIEAKLREAEAVLLFLSPNSMQSQYVKEEIRLFLEASPDGCIVPFQLVPEIDEEIIFESIRSRQRIIYRPSKRREQMLELISALRRC